MSQVDLFILAAEPSADLHGAKLVEKLLETDPRLHIAGVCGPRMRELPIRTILPMEQFQTMGFIDLLPALPRLIRSFYDLRKTILSLNPKALICIDYPGFNLRLERSLCKKHYPGKLIHFICPTVWAWGKWRIPLMAKNLDLLLTLFPFEKACFTHTSLPVHYVGHPLTQAIAPHTTEREPLLALFPGSRKAEIERNFPFQLAVARRLAALDPNLKIGISTSRSALPLQCPNAILFPPEKTYELMQRARLALATSGTVTLELALHQTPTVVNYAIRPLDRFLAQKIFRINLPFYCIVNILAQRAVFPELFGPHLTEENLYSHAKHLWFHPHEQMEDLSQIRPLLGDRDASSEAAKAILQLVN